MAAAANPTEKVLSEITALKNRVEKQDTVIDGLMKAVRQPASKAGVSTQEFLAKMTSGGTPFIVGDDGAMMPIPKRMNKPQGIGLGPICRALAKRAKPDIAYVSDDEAIKTFKDHPELLEKAALAENSGVTGGYTVPPGFSQQLLQLSIEDAIVQPRASIFPLTGQTLQLPFLDVTSTGASGQSPYLGGIVGSWTSEGATRAESEPVFRQLELTAWELSFYTVASNNLLADNAVGLDSLLTQLFPAAMTWYKDYAFLRGDSVGKPLGILGAGCTVQVTRGTASHFTFPDVGAMMARLFFRADRSSVCWVMHQSVIGDLFPMTTGTNGYPVFVPLNAGVQEKVPQTAGLQSFGSLMGYPVLVTEKLPPLGTAGDIMLCDFSKYVIGDRAEIQVEVSPHVKFLQNQMVWRVIVRVDGRPWLNSAITQADGYASWTVSPFIKLN